MKRAREREPSVVVFEEPRKRKQKGSIKRQPFLKGNVYRKRFSDNGGNGELNFKQIAWEVREFGMTGFTKKEQRRLQQQKAQSLGGKAPKKQKVPYPILMRAKRVQNQREAEQKELENAMGIFRKKNSQKLSSNLPKGVGRWKDHTKGLDGGKYKNGVQKLHKKDIVKFQRRKK